MYKETFRLSTKHNQLQVRRRRMLFNSDGSTRTSKLSAYVINPLQDYSGEPKKVQRACRKLFTSASIKKYKADEARENADPFAAKPQLPDGEVDQTEVIIMEDDHVSICKCIQITEDGETYYQHFNSVDVPPGTPVRNAPKLVTDMLKAAHIPTVVARYQAEQEYNEAKQNLDMEDNAANRQAEARLKIARDLTRQAYDEFEAG